MPPWVLALISVLALVLVLVLAAAVFYFWLKVFNGPDGERYRKLRMQGPFVPLSDAEIEADAQRLRHRNVQDGSGEA